MQYTKPVGNVISSKLGSLSRKAGFSKEFNDMNNMCGSTLSKPARNLITLETGLPKPAAKGQDSADSQDSQEC